MDNWQKIIQGYSKQSDQDTVKYLDAVVTSVREDYLRADVKFITGQTVSSMLNKSLEKLTVGQQVKVGYLTVPSKGWIALTNGEADPIREGGGVEIDNAAIITPAQASSLIVDEEVIYVDTHIPARVVYGKDGQWFYATGVPVWFVPYSWIYDPTDMPVSGVTADQMLSDATFMVDDNTKYVFKIDLASIQTTADYVIYTARLTYWIYELQSGVWTETYTDYRDSSMQLPWDYTVVSGYVQTDVLYSMGIVFCTDYINFANGVFNVSALPVYRTKNQSTGNVSVPTPFTNYYGDPAIWDWIGNVGITDDAEVIFAKGMTATTEVIP